MASTTSTSATARGHFDHIDILVVDDDEDVRTATKLALKRKTYRGIKLNLTMADSKKQAQEIISQDPGKFHVMLVDVVMEADTSGLELCTWIRDNCPPFPRIILRTGQPGVAPEATVLEKYDIDHYVAKTTATAEVLYNVVRSSVKTALDLLTLNEFQALMLDISDMYSVAKTKEDLVVVVKRNLDFLSAKHVCPMYLVTDLNTADSTGDIIGAAGNDKKGIDDLDAATASAKAKILEVLSSGASADDQNTFDFNDEAAAVMLCRLDKPLKSAGFYTNADKDKQARMGPDVAMMLDHWKIGLQAIQARVQKEKQEEVERQLYIEKLQNISMMVAGVSHEVNTPLGVAMTASSMLKKSVPRLEKFESLSKADRDEEIEDIVDCVVLVTKNIEKASKLVNSFKKLSTNQMIDERSECCFYEVVEDVVASYKPEWKKKKMQITIDPPAPDLLLREKKVLPWSGYPGHLSQAVLNFFQNTNRYGFPTGTPFEFNGKIDIKMWEEGDNYWLTFKDYGKGMPQSVCDQIFDPFFTTGRGSGGTGLGMAIVNNLVLQKLGGTIEAHSNNEEDDHYTEIKLSVPKVVPDEIILKK